ncbi:MAG: adenosylmethionine--8-amino-7-oxononanoate transaminase, partial [Planctomycetes bacterium]|nr:adenosylmethionine--8-amino-7-oxononanoate transaminase [Planctomycetota bacterium]
RVRANRLGAINHTLLSQEALRGRGIPVAAVVAVVTAPDSDDPLADRIRQDNRETVAARTGIPVPAEVPFQPGLTDPDETVREAAWQAIATSLEPVVARIAAAGPPPVVGREPPAHQSPAAATWVLTDNRLPTVSTTPAAATAGSLGSGDPNDTGAAADSLNPTTDIVGFDRDHLWHPYAATHPPERVWPAVATAGGRIRLADGRELVDGMSSWWAAIHGYNHPRLLAALRRQAATMPHVMFGGLTHEPAVALGRRLLALVPAGLERIFYADSGSVAVEAALKMAVQYHEARGDRARKRVVALRGGYHGDTLGAMSVCDPVGGMHRQFAGLLPQHLFAPRPSRPFGGAFQPEDARDMEALFQQHGPTIAAAIAEPVVQGAGGMWLYHPEYLRHLRRLCDEYGALLILDEIATGFGRTGRMFACEWAGVTPDIMCVGKALTGGCLSLAAVIARETVAAGIAAAGPFQHGPTFMANPLACAVAVASLDLLTESPWQERIRVLENRLRGGLEPCRHQPGVADVRVLGGIGVVEMTKAVAAGRLQEFFVQQGVWIRPFARLIYLMPPYATDEADLAALTGAIRAAVETGQWA